MGHVHLKVADLAQTETFYTQVVGLSLKNNFGNQAKFFAAGGYHHHIGSNKNVSFTLESSRRLALLDPNGIQVKMEY